MAFEGEALQRRLTCDFSLPRAGQDLLTKPVIAAIVLAAGSGSRAGPGQPKQFRKIGGVPMIERTLAAVAAHPRIDFIQPVVRRGDDDAFPTAAWGDKLRAPAIGGDTRQQSVHAGLEALADRKPAIVLIHDGARPFVSAALIDRAIAATEGARGALPVLAVTDTIKSLDPAGQVGATVPRDNLRIAQTPQAFLFDAILSAHRAAARAGRDDFTDDAALAEWAGLTLATFEGDPANMKLTTAEDFARAEAQLAGALGDIRIGNGFDVHAFGDGDHVMLGGVRVPFARGFLAHSDGDVGLHALVDAILGALGDGDIGAHFPPSDPKWKGATSDLFLKDAAARVRARGGVIAHLDLTLVCEAPRIGPHREAMRARIADIAGIAVGRVAVKATTSEKLGFTGRGEGIAAMACATIRLPWSGA